MLAHWTYSHTVRFKRADPYHYNLPTACCSPVHVHHAAELNSARVLPIPAIWVVRVVRYSHLGVLNGARNNSSRANLTASFPTFISIPNTLSPIQLQSTNTTTTIQPEEVQCFLLSHFFGSRIRHQKQGEWQTGPRIPTTYQKFGRSRMAAANDGPSGRHLAFGFRVKKHSEIRDTVSSN